MNGTDLPLAVLRPASILLAATLTVMSGCGWFRSKPAPVSAPPMQAAMPMVRAACPNSTEAWATAPFPRAAIARGLVEGHVTVRFRVDGTHLDIVDVTATDPSFGEAAAAVVKRYACSVEQPTTFEMAFAYKRG